MKLFRWLAVAIFWIYLIGVMVSAPVYNWKYANENGFFRWLMLGEIIATSKSIIWPYFLINNSNNTTTNKPKEWNKIEIDDFRHMLKSRDFDVSAAQIGRSFGPNTNKSSSEFIKYVELKQNALIEAGMVKEATLDKMYPGLSDKYKNTYIKSIQMQLQGINGDNFDTFIKGAELHNQWVDWFEAHKKNMYTPLEKDL
jgi:hypothetical protein